MALSAVSLVVACGSGGTGGSSGSGGGGGSHAGSGGSTGSGGVGGSGGSAGGNGGSIGTLDGTVEGAAFVPVAAVHDEVVAGKWQIRIADYEITCGDLVTNLHDQAFVLLLTLDMGLAWPGTHPVNLQDQTVLPLIYRWTAGGPSGWTSETLLLTGREVTIDALGPTETAGSVDLVGVNMSLLGTFVAQRCP